MRNVASLPEALAAVAGGQRLLFFPLALARAVRDGIEPPIPRPRILTPASLTIYSGARVEATAVPDAPAAR